MIFKLANVIINCSYDQPLLPILCQRFFTLYLTRVRLSTDEARFSDIHGVSDKFYEYNVPLFKKLKKFLTEAERNDKELSLKEEDELKVQFFSARAKCVPYSNYSFPTLELNLKEIISFSLQALQQFCPLAGRNTFQ